MNHTTLLLLGTISIGFATYISTVVLPNLESKINKIYLNMDQHISETRNTILMISFYGRSSGVRLHKFTKYKKI